MDEGDLQHCARKSSAFHDFLVGGEIRKMDFCRFVVISLSFLNQRVHENIFLEVGFVVNYFYVSQFNECFKVVALLFMTKALN